MSKLSLHLLPLLLLIACGTGPARVAPAPAPEKQVAVAAAKADVFYGVLTSRDSELVSAKVDGSVKQLLVRPGQTVKAGMTIAVLDDSVIAKQVEEARAAEDSAQGALVQAGGIAAEQARLYRVQQSLLKDRAVSRESVSSARSAAAVAGSQVTIARAALARARAAREQLELLRDQTTVVAPIDGVVTSPKVTEGQMAGRGQPIVRISNPSHIQVRFAVSREHLDKIQRGTRVRIVRVKGSTDTLVATVREVGNTLAPPLQFAIVEAELDPSTLPADQAALLGALVDVTIEV